MPEKIPWIAEPKEKSEERDRKSKDGSLLSRLGSSFSPSTSPSKRILSISSPITIPKPSLPISLASFSSSPKRIFKLSPSSSSQEDAQCHLAMEDHVIEQALRRARLQRSVACKEEEIPDDCKETERGEDEKNARESCQRLSDMSLSTDSSESLDFPQASFFFPPLHDPNPPTLDEINAHLPLSALSPFPSVELDDDDEDDEDDEEDFGVGLERAGAGSGFDDGASGTQDQTQEQRQRGGYTEGVEGTAAENERSVQFAQDAGEKGRLQGLEQDRVLEKAMHKCVLKPLRSVISDALHEAMISSGAWTELRENMNLAKNKAPADMGVSDALPPDNVAIEKIKQKFVAMCKVYSPEKKVGRLLQVCKLIYTVMEDNSGRLFGADDFLPMLTFVLAQCDMPQLDSEILYMMELLDPTLLNGEGGYYLTSAYGAMSLIKNFQEEQAARVLSSQTRDTLHQWHRRRTMQRTAPSIDDFQNYLRVALQELDSGCTAKTLCVHPQATAEDVCSLCAVKFSVSEPEKYSLFLVTEGSSQQLAPDIHPQKIKAELHSRDQPDAFHFVYRRTDFAANQAIDANANPTTTSDQENNLSPRLSLSLPQGNLNSVSI
ncbi:hypothetical protein WMY93_017975 [Mugilogobius chulae]|uniref:Ras and Rab interactor 2 n=1 Tax=Mugilogobius chulae TaxID=88201 RepID=A0AAW0NHS6_9GOBI